MKKRILLLAGIALTVLTGALLAASFPVKGTVSYTASGPTGSWTGTNSALKGDVTTEGGKVCIDMTQWDSKNTRRDNHTRDMFEVKTFPEACFTIKSISGNAIKGDLEMHGVTKPVEIQGTVKTGPNGISFQGKTVLLIDDFGMTRPAMMGMKVKNEVTIEIEAMGGKL